MLTGNTMANLGYILTPYQTGFIGLVYTYNYITKYVACASDNAPHTPSIEASNVDDSGRSSVDASEITYHHNAYYGVSM